MYVVSDQSKLEQMIDRKLSGIRSDLEAVLEEKLDIIMRKLNAGPDVKEWYSTQEYGDIIGVKPETVRKNYIETGRIEAEKCERGFWKIPHSEVVHARAQAKFMRG
jgi:hypothetical protein